MERTARQHSNGRNLSAKMQHLLTTQFHLNDQALEKLRCVEKFELYPGMRASYIRVYDPELVSPDRGATVRYDELQMSGNRKSLFFEGRVEKNGDVHITDRRPPFARQMAE